jgi:hypothetical protein
MKLLAVGALVVNAFVWGVSWWPLRQLQDAGSIFQFRYEPERIVI